MAVGHVKHDVHQIYVTKRVLYVRNNLSCTAPYIPYRVAISAQNSNPVAGEASNALIFSREGSEFVLYYYHRLSHCLA